MTLAQLRDAYHMGQPGCLERLAYYLDLDVREPSDRGGFLALVEYYWPGTLSLVPADELLGE